MEIMGIVKIKDMLTWVVVQAQTYIVIQEKGNAFL